MTATTIRVQMAQRKDTAANWTSTNPILLSGELGYETDTKKFKIGNGSTNWNSLTYLPIPDGSGNLTITGNLEIGTTGSLTFEGSTADGFETTLAVTNPTADRTITLPNQSGTVLVSGNASIVDADVSASAAIVGTKISPDFGSQTITTTGIVRAALGAAATPSITFTGDTNTGIYSPGADQVAITTGGTGRLFIDSSGRLLVGASTARSNFFGTTLSSLTQTEGTGGSTARGSLSVINNDVSNNPPYVLLGRSGAATLGSNAAVVSGSRLGTLTFHGADGTSFIEAATVAGEADGTPGANDMPGRLVFSTTADGAASPTERLRIDSTGQIQVASLGTAAAPIYSFLNDTNTGIYSPGADQLAISTNGTGRLFVDASGNIGVGITPASNFHVSGGALTRMLVSSTSAGARTDIAFRNSASVVTTVIGFDGTNSEYDYRSGDLVFKYEGTERLRITSAGLVGVGTSSPGEKLTIAGTSGSAAISLLETGVRNWAIRAGGAVSNSLDVADLTAGATRLTINSSGNVGVGTTNPLVNLEVASTTPTARINATGGGTPSLSLFSSGVYDWIVQGGTALKFVQDAEERARIDSSGRLGIGTSSPTASLSVNATTTSYVSTAFNVGEPSTSTGRQLYMGYNTTDSVGFIQSVHWGVEFKPLVLCPNGGSVGIGTTSPAKKLDVYEGSSGNIEQYLRNTTINLLSKIEGTTSAQFGTETSHPLLLLTGNSERARLTASGQLLVGTSSARLYTSLGYARFQLEGTSFADSSIGLTNNQATVDGAYLVFNKTRGTAIGSVTSVQSNDLLGSIWFEGADGTNLIRGATIEAAVDGTPGASDMPGRLVFSTTADGASSPTERMRITSGGEIQFGNTTVGAYTVTRNTGVCAYFDRRDSDGVALSFERQGSSVGNISLTTTATAYNTSSDYRLKKNVTLVTDGITRLQQLKPSRFNFIADSDQTVDGFLAHEVQTVVPEAITGTKDAVDAGGNPVYQGIDQSKLVPLLTAALQEAIGEIESLKARVAALEAN